MAWDTVRIKLQEIIDNEDKSQSALRRRSGDELGKHGLTVARRTVTKYRKAMNIPSSRQRRDWTAAPKDNGAPAKNDGSSDIAAAESATTNTIPEQDSSNGRSEGTS